MGFGLTIHKLGTNRYEEEITSCVLEEVDAPADTDFEDDGLTDKQRAGEEVLEDLVNKKNPVEMAAWANQLKATAPFQKQSSEESQNRQIRKVRTELAAKGLLSCDKQKQLLTYIADKGAASEKA